MLKTKQVSFFFQGLDSQTFAPFTKLESLREHGVDLGGLLGVSCTDLQVSPVQVGDSSHPGHVGIRLHLNQATHMGFFS